MSTQREQVIAAIRSIIAAPRSAAALKELRVVLEAAQNGPPDGAADGSLTLEAWQTCRDLHDSLSAAQRALDRAADALREPAPCPF